MAFALDPEGVMEAVDRPVSVELEGALSRGTTVVDWNRQLGRPDNARILMGYDQGRFEARVRSALAD